MAKYSEQLQQIVQQYRDAGNKWPATAKEMATWAINKGLWRPQPGSIVAQCAEHIAKAMREEYVVDPQGRKVRTKHAVVLPNGGEQLALWADIRTAPRAHMAIAFQQRRNQIVGDCKHLKIDVDSYNDNANPGVPIQMVFDFTEDIQELELAEA